MKHPQVRTSRANQSGAGSPQFRLPPDMYVHSDIMVILPTRGSARREIHANQKNQPELTMCGTSRSPTHFIQAGQVSSLPFSLVESLYRENTSAIRAIANGSERSMTKPFP